ncbi:peptidoglycan DD-metalloendopeptidase family protein [Candidatus Peregrinibacteria bacterium]|nr:peptidoglycan DD-metalloendopeptidase family protein [Candidatus Peregrinibacteria bacterium]
MNMRNKIAILLTLGTLIFAIFIHTGLLLAQNNPQSVPESDFVATKQSLPEEEAKEEEIDPKQAEKDKFMEMIKAELSAAQKDLFDTRANVKDAEDKIDGLHEEIVTLSDQLANLDYQIRVTEKLIVDVTKQIKNKESELIVLEEDLRVKSIEIENQKQMLSEYLATLYERENSISDTFTSNKEINIAKLLLGDEPVADQLQEIRYFNILEDQGHAIFKKLEQLVEELESEKMEIKTKRVKLMLLNRQLDDEKVLLEEQKQSKKTLLEQTRGEEEIFQSLLQESQRQQAQIQEEIIKLQENLAYVKAEMELLGDRFDPKDYEALFSGEKISIYEFINATKDLDGEMFFRWPVYPGRGISAYFRDPSYVHVFGVGHNAIDIPVPQKTKIRAPASGVVFKVKDNGMGYSYLILAHRGGYMTVYGHIYEFLVEEGEKVLPGQPIALSGGAPGTKGAGLMTTGSHLHFEVMLGGNYVDPLYLLPLNYLPEDKLLALPARYHDLANTTN